MPKPGLPEVKDLLLRIRDFEANRPSYSRELAAAGYVPYGIPTMEELAAEALEIIEDMNAT